MPSFCAIRPVRITRPSKCYPSFPRKWESRGRGTASPALDPRFRGGDGLMGSCQSRDWFLQLDLDVDAGGEIELHQRIDGLRRRIDDVEHPLVRADLELLARFLVDMGRAQHRELLDLGWQRDRAAHPRSGPLRGIDALAGRLIEHAMIVRPEADADVLVVAYHRYLLLRADGFLISGSWRRRRRRPYGRPRGSQSATPHPSRSAPGAPLPS